MNRRTFIAGATLIPASANATQSDINIINNPSTTRNQTEMEILYSKLKYYDEEATKAYAYVRDTIRKSKLTGQALRDFDEHLTETICEPVQDQAFRLEDEILAMEPICLSDLAIKTSVIFWNLDFEINWARAEQIKREAEALI